MSNPSRSAEIAAGLRQLADLIEANPQIRVAYTNYHFWSLDSREEMAELARAALRHGAKVEKQVTDEMYNLDVKFGPITASALAMRDEMCERVVVGTREVTEMVPDPSLPAPPMVEQTRTEEVYEWKCVPLMADAEATT